MVFTVSLQAYCAQAEDEALEIVALHCPRLMRLDVCFCLQIRDSGIVCIAEECKDLRVVLLNGCEGLTDFGLERLVANCPHLGHVTVCRTSSPDISPEMAAKVRSLKSADR